VDLKTSNSEPRVEERAAVDSVLGPEVPTRDHLALGGHATRERRHLLLPVLHAINDRVGWLSREALDHVARRLEVPPADVFGVASFYHWFSLEPRLPVVAHVCDDVACRARGAEALCARISSELGPEGSTRVGTKGTWHRSPCLGLCEQGPAALVVSAGAKPASATLGDLKGPMPIAAALARVESVAQRRSRIPQTTGLELLARVGRCETVADYEAQGGYEGLKKALALGPQAVCAEVTASKLVGRGGAAFSTGRKWSAVLGQKARPRYLVCNADESEPGTFKDRILMEEDPFAILEGMTIGALATGCEKGFIYVRVEYPSAVHSLDRAIRAAREAGRLGKKILGSELTFDVEIRRGAGAYICGEETALFASIEGFRGEPRSKPPFPVEVGLFGKPTVINNVETFANVPIVLRKGGAVFAKTGTAESTGTKLFCVSGHVERPGLYEVPFGTTLGQLLGLAGGVSGGRALKAVLMGGAAGTFIGPEKLDMPLTFEGTRAAGTTLGSGVVLVLDETADLGDILLRIAAFFRAESCGQCVPCRVGTMRQEELLQRVSRERPIGSLATEKALLGELSQCMKDASICGLGQTASTAIVSAIGRWNPFPASGGPGAEPPHPRGAK
jgi:NADH-quinone oxidoreductase subunit F